MSVQDDPSWSLVAEVLIDSVGLSKVFSYGVPDKYRSQIGIGSYVSVRLGNSRMRGWVVGLGEMSGQVKESLEFKLSPISRLLGGGPSPEVIALCKWAAWRFIGSPVSFMTHASPKNRVPSRAGGELDFRGCGTQFRLARGESLVVRIPPGHSRAEWITGHLGDPMKLMGQVIIVCPTQNAVRHISHSLQIRGFQTALFPEEFQSARDGAQVVIGARNAVFASVAQLSQIIVVDCDDPSHTESSSPVWSSFQVARARVEQSQRVVLLSSVPSVETMFGARTISLGRTMERSGWPRVLVADISEASVSTPLVSPGLISQIHAGLKMGVRPPIATREGLIDYDGVVVLYNRLGGARTLICSKCNQVVSCVKCSTTLMQTPPDHMRMGSANRREINKKVKQSLLIAGLTCPRCKEEYPTICTHCMSGSLKVVTFGIERFRALLEAAIGSEVSEVDAASEIEISKLGRVTIATEAVFTRFGSAKMVVVADFDHYLYAATLNAREQALSLLSRVSRLVPPRSANTGYVPIFIQTRDINNIVLKSAVHGDPRLLIKEEADLRKRLNLPPFGAIVRVWGPKAAVWIETSGIGAISGIELIQANEGVFDLRSDSKEGLLDLIAERRSIVSASGVRFLADSY
ncbi:MAG: hypothetical protein HKL84_06410 [Acidimicrobiaceae bacterium]|nr:hypothetical protein [Acidimicrobiaceae bacterium]